MCGKYASTSWKLREKNRALQMQLLVQPDGSIEPMDQCKGLSNEDLQSTVDRCSFGRLDQWNNLVALRLHSGSS